MKQLKAQTEELLRLCSQANKLKGSLCARVQEIARRYIDAAHDTNRGYGFPDVGVDFDDWHIDGNDIVVSWSNTWAYGGYDEGSFCFPAKYLYDEDALIEFEKKRVVDKEKAKQKAEEKQRQKDEVELEKLKEKLGK